jgi:hypothetical protein
MTHDDMSKGKPGLMKAILAIFMLSMLPTLSVRAEQDGYDFTQMIQPVPLSAKFEDPGFVVWCGTCMLRDEKRTYHLYYSALAARTRPLWLGHPLGSCIDATPGFYGLANNNPSSNARRGTSWFTKRFVLVWTGRPCRCHQRQPHGSVQETSESGVHQSR